MNAGFPWRRVWFTFHPASKGQGPPSQVSGTAVLHVIRTRTAPRGHLAATHTAELASEKVVASAHPWLPPAPPPHFVKHLCPP